MSLGTRKSQEPGNIVTRQLLWSLYVTFKLQGKAALEETVSLGCHWGFGDWWGREVRAQGLLFSLPVFIS